MNESITIETVFHVAGATPLTDQEFPPGRATRMNDASFASHSGGNGRAR